MRRVYGRVERVAGVRRFGSRDGRPCIKVQPEVTGERLGSVGMDLGSAVQQSRSRADPLPTREGSLVAAQPTRQLAADRRQGCGLVVRASGWARSTSLRTGRKVGLGLRRTEDAKRRTQECLMLVPGQPRSGLPGQPGLRPSLQAVETRATTASCAGGASRRGSTIAAPLLFPDLPSAGRSAGRPIGDVVGSRGCRAARSRPAREELGRETCASGANRGFGCSECRRAGRRRCAGCGGPSRAGPRTGRGGRRSAAGRAAGTDRVPRRRGGRR